jgi:hypothetical protein
VQRYRGDATLRRTYGMLMVQNFCPPKCVCLSQNLATHIPFLIPYRSTLLDQSTRSPSTMDTSYFYHLDPHTDSDPPAPPLPHSQPTPPLHPHTTPRHTNSVALDFHTHQTTASPPHRSPTHRPDPHTARTHSSDTHRRLAQQD